MDFDNRKVSGDTFISDDLVLLWFVVTVAIVTGGFLTVCLVFERFTIGRLRVEHTMQIFYLQSHLDLFGKNGCNV